MGPSEGRCEGTRAVFCMGGEMQQIDCAQKGLHCVLGAEGADCREEPEAGQRCPRTPYCEGETLVGCKHGLRVRTPCDALGAQCASGDPSHAGRCELTLKASPQEVCGPCGCKDSERELQHACNGIDDDSDGLSDEGVDCGPVPVVAFLVGDDAGNTSHAEEDVREDLLRTNALLATAGVPGAPVFALAETVWWNDCRLVSLDESELATLAHAAHLRGGQAGFYVPLVFTERITSEGGVPKAGLATLPNGTCGGMQLGTGPAHGVIAVAKGRSHQEHPRDGKRAASYLSWWERRPYALRSELRRRGRWTLRYAPRSRRFCLQRRRGMPSALRGRRIPRGGQRDELLHPLPAPLQPRAGAAHAALTGPAPRLATLPGRGMPLRARRWRVSARHGLQTAPGSSGRGRGCLRTRRAPSPTGPLQRQPGMCWRCPLRHGGAEPAQPVCPYLPYE